MAKTRSVSQENITDKVMETNTQSSDIDVAALLKQVQSLQKQIADLTNATESNNNISDKEKMIPFVSLTNGSVLLRGSDIKPYEIEGQYTVRSFPESEAKVIVSLMGRFMRQGYVYIDDAAFVKSSGLGEVYKTMLTPKQLKGLLDNDIKTVMSLYETASDGQRTIIIDMVGKKLAEDEMSVDANLVKWLEKTSGIKFNIDDDK